MRNQEFLVVGMCAFTIAFSSWTHAKSYDCTSVRAEKNGKIELNDNILTIGEAGADFHKSAQCAGVLLAGYETFEGFEDMSPYTVRVYPKDESTTLRKFSLYHSATGLIPNGWIDDLLCLEVRIN